MQTRHIEEILKAKGFDVGREYERLYTLFYDEKSVAIDDVVCSYITLRNICKRYFKSYRFRGTCISLDDYERSYGLCYDSDHKANTVQELAIFCEHIANLLAPLKDILEYARCSDYYQRPLKSCLSHIHSLTSKMGYGWNYTTDGLIKFVPRDANATAVAEILQDDDLSYKVIEYNHHSLAGKIGDKRSIINRLSSKLEPNRNALKALSPKLESLLFWAFNNLNIRHNNSSSEDSAKYREPIAKMRPVELEKYYDDVYQLCLQAFITLDNVEKQNRLIELQSISQCNTHCR